MELLIEKQFHFLFHLECMVSVEALKSMKNTFQKAVFADVVNFISLRS